MCATVCVVHLQRDPVVFPRFESVDVIVPYFLHHGRQLSVTLNHDATARLCSWSRSEMSCGRVGLSICL